MRQRDRWVRVAGIIAALVGGGGCCFNASSPSGPTKVRAHYAEWSDLVTAAVHFDRQTVSMITGELTDGGLARPADPGQEQVAAALAFLAFAESPEELSEALTQAAEGCGRCHQSRGVAQTSPVKWAHETGAEWALGRLIWPSSASQKINAAPWSVPTAGPTDRRWAEAQLLHCVRCHGRR